MEALTFMINWAAIIALAQFIGTVWIALCALVIGFYATSIGLLFFFGKGKD